MKILRVFRNNTRIFSRDTWGFQGFTRGLASESCRSVAHSGNQAKGRRVLVPTPQKSARTGGSTNKKHTFPHNITHNICTYMYMYICIYVSMYTCIYVYMYICIYVYMCIYIHMYICIYVNMYICIFVYVYMCMCVHVYTVCV